MSSEHKKIHLFKGIFEDLLFCAGSALVAYGLYLIQPFYCFIFAGILLMWMAWKISR
jgi:hypothetical protein